MSLLLDALRRAGAARGDDIAEKVDRRPAVEGNFAGRAGADEFDLDVDAATAPQATGETSRSPGGTAGSGLKGPARAEAVFRGGAPGGRVIRTAALFALAAITLVGGLAVGGWYYYESTRSAVDRELVRYTPDPAADRMTGTDDAADPATDEAPAPGALASAELASADFADSDKAGADTSAPEGDGATATTHATRADGDAGTRSGGAEAEPNAGTASASDGAAAGDAGTPARGTASADEDAASATAKADSASGASDPAESATGNATSASTASPDKRASNEEARAAGAAGEAPMVRRTGSGDGRSPLGQALQDGYRALRSGDLMAARRHYRRAVEIDPSNRDARLGAAAVAQRQGNAAAAIDHYRRVLADHPRDPYARSGLASLQSTADPRQLESELKTLLKQDPNAHALRYALGNLYARENRWSQAQSAYFEAFRAAPKEADYAFNLAVALDQLGQRESAAEYYEQALELAADGSGSFPLESARGRLESLRQ